VFAVVQVLNIINIYESDNVWHYHI